MNKLVDINYGDYENKRAYKRDYNRLNKIQNPEFHSAQRRTIYKRYYEKQREKKVNCDCGGVYMPVTAKEHMNSLRHTNYLRVQKGEEPLKPKKGGPKLVHKNPGDEARKYVNAKDKFDCPCGGRYTRSYAAMHKKSKIHMAYMAGIAAKDAKDNKDDKDAKDDK